MILETESQHSLSEPKDEYSDVSMIMDSVKALALRRGMQV
jgi:hypothetical protein